MELFFRIFKREWMAETGSHHFSEAELSIINYIIGYYSSVRPHQHNNGKSQNEVEGYIGRPLNLWPNLVDHYRIIIFINIVTWPSLLLGVSSLNTSIATNSPSNNSCFYSRNYFHFNLTFFWNQYYFWVSNKLSTQIVFCFSQFWFSKINPDTYRFITLINQSRIAQDRPQHHKCTVATDRIQAQ